MPSAPPDAVTNDPALANNDPTQPDDALPSPILIVPYDPAAEDAVMEDAPVDEQPDARLAPGGASFAADAIEDT